MTSSAESSFVPVIHISSSVAQRFTRLLAYIEIIYNSDQRYPIIAPMIYVSMQLSF